MKSPFIVAIENAFADYYATLLEIDGVTVNATHLNLITGIEPHSFMAVCDGPHGGNRACDSICGF